MGDTDQTGATGSAPFRYRGNRLGMPEHGTGSIPPAGRRLVGVVLDWVLALAVTVVLGIDPVRAGTTVLLVFAVLTIAPLILFGTTVGKRVVGVEVAMTGERSMPWPLAMVLRTALLCVVVPPVVYDRDQRGLHDRAAGTVTRRL